MTDSRLTQAGATVSDPSTGTAAARCKRRVRPVFVLALVATVVSTFAIRSYARDQATPALDRLGGITHLNGARPPAGLEERGHPLGKAAPLIAPSSSFAFKTGEPVTWSPCRPIHYVVRPDNGPPDSQALVASTIAQLSRATGLVFIDDGTTTERPTENRPGYLPALYGDRWAPVLITWATHKEVPRLAGETGGMAHATLEIARGQFTYVSGFAILDAPTIKKALSNPKKAHYARIALLHELAHIVGLGHVNDPSQVMNPRAGKPFTGYQSGDLAGLRRLGQGPCQPGV